MTQGVHSVHGTQIDLSRSSAIQVHVSSQPEDSLWDSFLKNTPGGHHVQTSLWAQVKGLLEYRALRVVLSHPNHTIMSGAQILYRSFPLIGNVGFVSKGPLLAGDDPVLQERTIQEMLRAARQAHVPYLLVQPPNNGDALAEKLTEQGFQPVNVNLAPTSTVLIDLSKDLNAILAEMKPRTRYNIRLGERKGMKVRLGTEKDLGVFYELLKVTSQRKNFSIYSAAYYEKLFQLFHPHGFADLFVVEFEGEVVSARLSVSFGDSVINKLSVWSGRHGKFRPNEALQWAVIKWAKEHGYRYYDLEGVDAEEAQEVGESDNDDDRKPQTNTVSSFKLGFGGQLTFYPKAYLYIASAVVRPAYRYIYPKTANSRVVKKLVSYIRTS